ncbi:MAG TPA: cytochrome P450 [Tepidisphaeraceae bacterium]|nr:cytochrome P450 [Tepidisphaeraceae bacterium]
MDIFSDDIRRNPYPLYAQLRSRAPVFKIPPPFDAWMILDYDGVKRALSDAQTFSSRVPAPRNWFIFFDPPRHTKLRAIISKAFTPKMIAGLEPRIHNLSRQLLDDAVPRGRMDLAAEYSVPLPMKIIAQMIGIPGADWSKFKSWSDIILKVSYARTGTAEAQRVVDEFVAVSGVMNDYLTTMIDQRRIAPQDDLLTKLIEAEVDGQHLTQEEILGFFQLLVVGGQETTTNLINNAIISLLENPTQLSLLRSNMNLVESAIEEVLRYRSPIQWMLRTPTREIEIAGQTLSPGQLILANIGSANRDQKHFNNAESFDIIRHPNDHIAFGHGPHFCLGSALARMEAKIALTDLLNRLHNFEFAIDQPWQPRQALHVHGPTNLSIRFQSPS